MPEQIQPTQPDTVSQTNDTYIVNYEVPMAETTEKFDDYLLTINKLEVFRKHTAVVPTNKPTKFIDQFVFYNNAGDYRLYVYIDGGWRYISLT